MRAFALLCIAATAGCLPHPPAQHASWQRGLKGHFASPVVGMGLGAEPNQVGLAFPGPLGAGLTGASEHVRGGGRLGFSSTLSLDADVAVRAAWTGRTALSVGVDGGGAWVVPEMGERVVPMRLGLAAPRALWWVRARPLASFAIKDFSTSAAAVTVGGLVGVHTGAPEVGATLGWQDKEESSLQLQVSWRDWDARPLVMLGFWLRIPDDW